jgi:hypothetical protein
MATPPYPPRQPLPWNGPPFEPVQPTLGILQKPSSFPFLDASVQNPDLFPPVCIRSHWDPTKIIARTLPQTLVSTPLDPRPWTKVCLNYVTSQDFEEAPRPADNTVFPMGGSVYPPTRYREAIDQESELRRLDRPLGTCQREEYTPSYSGSLYRAGTTIPDKGPVSDMFIQELAFPKACIRTGPYPCRQEAEEAAWVKSNRMFNNTTKQDRYTKIRPPSQPVTAQFRQVLN